MTLFAQLILVLVMLLPTYSRSESNSIEGFPSELTFADLVKRLHAQQAQIDLLTERSMQPPSICRGRVASGEFLPYSASIGIFIQVNTAHCQFRDTPTYLTSLGGMNSIWYIHGATAIYNATSIGFRVYLGTGDNITTSEELLIYAIKRGWVLNWIGLE